MDLKRVPVEPLDTTIIHVLQEAQELVVSTIPRYPVSSVLLSRSLNAEDHTFQVQEKGALVCTTSN